MANVSRPLLVLLVGTVAAFAVWTVALKPSSSGSGGSQGVGAYSSAIAKARHVAGLSASASAAESGAPPAGSGSAAQRPVAPRAPGQAPAGASSKAPSGQQAAGSARSPASAASKSLAPTPVAAAGPAELKAAIAAHEVVVLLFYNPAGPDDQAVKQELGSLPVPTGVLVLTAPVADLAQFSAISQQVPVTQSPTLVFIDRHGRATTITGFADGLEISQRLADTLGAH